MDKAELKEVKLLATKIRKDVMEMLRHRGYGHLGGSLSIVELMAVLYGKVLHVDPSNPQMEDRDMVVLSKGHCGPAWYSALAEKGYFPKEKLMTLNDGGTMLPSHPDRTKTPGVDMTTGSLGQGTSSAAGIAYGQRLKGSKRFTYLIVGDGELNEGQCWEAAMFTAAKKLTNITWIIDDNKRQLDGWTANVLNPFNFEEKFRAFGFDAVTVKGDDVMGLYEALTAPAGDKPKAIVLDSVKGAGVADVVNTFGNHSMSPSKDTCDKWLAELRAELAAME